MLKLSFLDVFEKKGFFSSFLNLHGLNLEGARNFLQSGSLTSSWEGLKTKKQTKKKKTVSWTSMGRGSKC